MNISTRPYQIERASENACTSPWFTVSRTPNFEPCIETSTTGAGAVVTQRVWRTHPLTDGSLGACRALIVARARVSRSRRDLEWRNANTRGNANFPPNRRRIPLRLTDQWRPSKTSIRRRSLRNTVCRRFPSLDVMSYPFDVPCCRSTAHDQ